MQTDQLYTGICQVKGLLWFLSALLVIIIIINITIIFSIIIGLHCFLISKSSALLISIFFTYTHKNHKNLYRGPICIRRLLFTRAGVFIWHLLPVTSYKMADTSRELAFFYTKPFPVILCKARQLNLHKIYPDY